MGRALALEARLRADHECARSALRLDEGVTSAVREADVEDEGIEALMVECFPGSDGAVHGHDLLAVEFEELSEGFPKDLIVIHDQ